MAGWWQASKRVADRRGHEPSRAFLCFCGHLCLLFNKGSVVFRKGQGEVAGGACHSNTSSSGDHFSLYARGHPGHSDTAQCSWLLGRGFGTKVVLWALTKQTLDDLSRSCAPLYNLHLPITAGQMQLLILFDRPPLHFGSSQYPHPCLPIPPGPAAFLMVPLPDPGTLHPTSETRNTQWAKQSWWNNVAWRLQTLTVTAHKVYEKWVPADPSVPGEADNEWDTVNLWSGQTWALEGVTVSTNWVWERWRLCPDSGIPVSAPCATPVSVHRAAKKHACWRCLSKPYRNLAVLSWHSRRRLKRARHVP